MLQKPT